MKPSELRLIMCCSLLFYVIHGPFHGKASAEIPIEDTPQFHSQKHERSHLLAHLADRMDLDGEGLRHIQRHLSEVTGESEQNQDVKDVEAGDNAKGIFYFFKLHDYDDNEKLDGLEWMKALTDFHQDDNDKGEFKEGGRVFLEHEAEAIIDELLTKHDLNDDGMIDFLELMNSRVKSLMTDLDKPVPEEDGGEQEQQSSLEQEFKQLQQGQQHSEHDQPQHENEKQEDRQQDQQEEQNQGEPNSEELQGDQEEQDKQQQHEPSLDDEYQQHQQEGQQQEQTQQDQSHDGKQGDQEQQDNWQEHEPSLDDEYKQQQQNHEQEDQQQEQNQQEHNPEETQGDQEQLQREPSLEDEYNQQQQQH